MVDRLCPWPEQRPRHSECERRQFAEEASAYLPKHPAPMHVSDNDLRAMKAAFIKRFDEQLPRTETLFAVANIGYRMALRDMAAGALTSSDRRERL